MTAAVFRTVLLGSIPGVRSANVHATMSASDRDAPPREAYVAERGEAWSPGSTVHRDQGAGRDEHARRAAGVGEGPPPPRAGGGVPTHRRWLHADHVRAERKALRQRILQRGPCRE